MPEIKQGTVTVTLPDHIQLAPSAGSLSVDEVRRLPKTRKSLGLVCSAVAAAIRKNPERLCPHGVDPDRLEAMGRAAEDMTGVVVDLKAATLRAAQGDLLLGAEAHDVLRRVMAFVRSQEKFDPHVADLVPQLVSYFSRKVSAQADKVPAQIDEIPARADQSAA